MPIPDTIRWIADFARRAPRVVPKGIYRYRSHEEADQDKDAWVTNGVVERVQEMAQRRKSPDHIGDADLPACRAATWEDVLMVTGLLEQHAAKYVLVGGYALMVNGIVRQTGDVDIVVENSVENNAKWIAAMAELPDREAAVLIGEDDPFPRDDDPYGKDEGPCVLRIADVIVVDVMPRACGLTFAQLVPNIVRVEVGADQEISVLDLYGLWLTKQAPRDKDRADKTQISMR